MLEKAEAVEQQVMNNVTKKGVMQIEMNEEGDEQDEEEVYNVQPMKYARFNQQTYAAPPPPPTQNNDFDTRQAIDSLKQTVLEHQKNMNKELESIRTTVHNNNNTQEDRNSFKKRGHFQNFKKNGPFKCYNCQQTGHKRRNCPLTNGGNTTNSFTQPQMQNMNIPQQMQMYPQMNGFPMMPIQPQQMNGYQMMLTPQQTQNTNERQAQMQQWAMVPVNTNSMGVSTTQQSNFNGMSK